MQNAARKIQPQDFTPRIPQGGHIARKEYKPWDYNKIKARLRVEDGQWRCEYLNVIGRGNTPEEAWHQMWDRYNVMYSGPVGGHLSRHSPLT